MSNKIKDISIKMEPSTSQTKQRVTQIIIDLLIICITGAIFLIIYLTVDPKIKYFYCNDNDIFYPYIPDTVPFWAVGIFGILGPLLIILVVELLNIFLEKQPRHVERSKVKEFFIHFFHAVSLFAMGVVITLVLTEIGKRWIGRLRPYFIAKCKPDYSLFNCTSSGLTGVVYNPIYTGGSFCTGAAKDVEEARLSFPSGHASFSWFTMLFAIIYLEARSIRLRLRYVKIIVQMACFIAAWVTTLSRVSDYHHRGSDVLAGTVLGCMVALFITLVTGRVLFYYNRIVNHMEIDLKPQVNYL